MSEPAMCNRPRRFMGIDLHKAIVLAAFLLLLYLASWGYLRDQPFESMVLSDASSIIINGLAVLCLLWAAAASRCYSKRLYYSWLLLFASQFCFFFGDILFTYYDLILEQSTFPSYADIFYLLSYPLFLSGILLLPAADFKHSERYKLLLDTGIVLVFSILIYWSFFVAPTIEQNIGADPQVMMLSVAYPIGDLMQLFALVELLFRRTIKSGGYSLLFLALFCAGNIFVDAVYMRESLAGTYVSGGFMDTFWIFSYLMIGLAGIAQVDDLRGGGKVRLNSGQRYGEIMWPLYLPYICASLAFVMLIYAYENPLSVPFSILSFSVGLIIAMVIARQVLVLRENAALYKEAQEEISGRKAMQTQIIKLNSELESRVADRTSELEKANADLQSQVLERKAAEEALKNSERRLSDIIDFLPDATFVINQSGVVIAWNRAIEKMTGIKASQILGLGDYEYALPFYGTRRPILADITLNPAPGLEKRYDNFRWQEDGTATGDVFIPNLNGKPAHIQGVAAVLYDSEGGVYGAIESLRDITERKNAEEDLKKARDRAESATEAKSKFLANMSHEIRTPMNAVIGMSDLLLQMDPTAEQRDYLDVIKNSGNALLAIINNILDYSKIDGDKLELDMRPFDLRRCIEVSMDLVAAEAGEKDIELTYFVDDSVPEMIISDEVRLKQILINLLGNAVKFTERGDVSLTVGSRPVPGGKIRLCFSVKDTGIG
ncbi:MAG: histidine kinase dimerization/phospho-acceptor domain-containing protein, partial [Methanothrix sp.]